MQQESSFDGAVEQGQDSPVLRLATDADYAFAETAYLKAYKETMIKQFGPWDEVAMKKDFAQVWKDSDIEIITVNGEPSGFIQVEESPKEHPNVIWIHELVLLPEAQRKGIGSNLLQRVQETARQKGLSVNLNVLHENPAIDLYRRFGFVQIGDTETYTEMEWKPNTSK